MKKKAFRINKIKEFFSKNKKVVIPVAVVLLLLIIAAICFGARSCVRKEADKPNKTLLAQAENTNAPAETNTETPEATQAATDNTVANGTQSGAATPATSVAGTTASGSNSTGGNSSSGATPSGGGNSGSVPPASHTHTWVNHTATKQVWVPKMVTVDDYETKKIPGGQLYTLHDDGKWYSDGETYWFYTDADSQAFKELIVNKMKTEDYCGNYVNRTKTEKTKVGSHQEDQGHYETQTYVDYQYCPICGQRK